MSRTVTETKIQTGESSSLPRLFLPLALAGHALLMKRCHESLNDWHFHLNRNREGQVLVLPGQHYCARPVV